MVDHTALFDPPYECLIGPTLSVLYFAQPAVFLSPGVEAVIVTQVRGNKLMLILSDTEGSDTK